jgi:hypothetical protein
MRNSVGVITLFGFGKGKIEITLDKFNYAPGETIKGKVILKLNKPVKAKRLKLCFYGEKTVYDLDRFGNRHSEGYHRGSGVSGVNIHLGSTPSSYNKRKVRVYSFEMELDGEKEYNNAEYEFEIKIPPELFEKAKIEGTGLLTNFMKLVAAAQARNVAKWYIEAVLDVPLGIDVKKKVQINIV